MNQIANLRRASNKDERCKKHAKHPQSPGVCSLCLNEKLAQVTSATASGFRIKLQAAAEEGSCSVSSVSSYDSSCSSSSCPSPLPAYHLNEGEIRSSCGASIFLLNGEHSFTKSNSMASVVPRTIIGAERVVEKRKKQGFWSRLLHPNSKRSMVKTDQLFHSRTLAIR